MANQPHRIKSHHKVVMAPSKYLGEITEGDERFMPAYAANQQYSKLQFDDKEILIGSFVKLNDISSVYTNDRSAFGLPSHAQVYRILKSRQGALILVLWYYLKTESISKLPMKGPDIDFPDLSEADVFWDTRQEPLYGCISREHIKKVTSCARINFKDDPLEMVEEANTRYCTRFRIARKNGTAFLYPNRKPTDLAADTYSHESLSTSQLNAPAAKAKPIQPISPKPIQPVSPKPSTSKQADEEDARRLRKRVQVQTVETTESDEDESSEKESTSDEQISKKRPVPKTKQTLKSSKPSHPALETPPKRRMFHHKNTVDDSSFFEEESSVKPIGKRQGILKTPEPKKQSSDAQPSKVMTFANSPLNASKSHLKDVNQHAGETENKVESDHWDKEGGPKNTRQAIQKDETTSILAESLEDPSLKMIKRKPRTVFQRAYEAESEDENTLPFAVSKKASRAAKEAALKKKQEKLLTDDVFGFGENDSNPVQIDQDSYSSDDKGNQSPDNNTTRKSTRLSSYGEKEEEQKRSIDDDDDISILEVKSFTRNSAKKSSISPKNKSKTSQSNFSEDENDVSVTHEEDSSSDDEQLFSTKNKKEKSEVGILRSPRKSSDADSDIEYSSKFNVVEKKKRRLNLHTSPSKTSVGSSDDKTSPQKTQGSASKRLSPRKEIPTKKSSNPEGTKVNYRRMSPKKMDLSSTDESDDDKLFSPTKRIKKVPRPVLKKGKSIIEMFDADSSGSSDREIFKTPVKNTPKKKTTHPKSKQPQTNLKEAEVENSSEHEMEGDDVFAGVRKAMESLVEAEKSATRKSSRISSNERKLLDMLQDYTDSDRKKDSGTKNSETVDTVMDHQDSSNSSIQDKSPNNQHVRTETVTFTPVIRPEGAPIGTTLKFEVPVSAELSEEDEYMTPSLLSPQKPTPELLQEDAVVDTSKTPENMKKTGIVTQVMTAMIHLAKSPFLQFSTSRINKENVHLNNSESRDQELVPVQNDLPELDTSLDLVDLPEENSISMAEDTQESLNVSKEEQEVNQEQDKAEGDDAFTMDVELHENITTRPPKKNLEPAENEENLPVAEKRKGSGSAKKVTPRKKQKVFDPYENADFKPQKTTRQAERKKPSLENFETYIESYRASEMHRLRSSMSSPQEHHRIDSQCLSSLQENPMVEVLRAGDKDDIAKPGSSKEIPPEEKIYKISGDKSPFPKKLSITLTKIDLNELTASEVESSDGNEEVIVSKNIPSILRPKKAEPAKSDEPVAVSPSVANSPSVSAKKPRKEKQVVMTDDQIRINGRKSNLSSEFRKASTNRTLVASPAKDGSLRMRIRSPEKTSRILFQEATATAKTPEKKAVQVESAKNSPSQGRSLRSESAEKKVSPTKQTGSDISGKNVKAVKEASPEVTTPNRRGRSRQSITPSKDDKNVAAKSTPQNRSQRSTPLRKESPNKDTSDKEDTPKRESSRKDTPIRGRRSLQLSTPTKSSARRRISVAPRMETVDEETPSKKKPAPQGLQTPEPKGRGRPRRAMTPITYKDSSEEESTPQPKKRGRPAFKTSIETPKVGRGRPRKNEETPSKSSTSATPRRTPGRGRKLAVEKSDFEEQKMPGREEQMANIQDFIESRIDDKSGGCMYISGLPGTGKTASVNQVLRNLIKMRENNECDFKLIQVSGMELTQPQQVFCRMADILLESKMTPAIAQSSLSKFFANKDKKRPSTILVIDELDMLCTKKQDVIYHLFDWPTKASARLIVLTIANTMDLPERLLQGKVTSRMGLTRLTFRPYTYDQLEKIVHVKLGEVGEFDRDARQLVARKVASLSGDARRALDICRRALELAADDKGGSVQMSHVMQALKEMLESPIVEAIKNLSPLEKLFLECMASEVQRTGVEETTLGEVLKSMRASGIYHGVTDFTNSKVSEICARLASSRLVLAEQDRAGLKQRISLNVNTDDLHYALKVQG